VNKIIPDKFKNPAEFFAAQQILPVTYKEISARGVFSTFSAKDKKLVQEQHYE
jgi:hypothetical protein